MKIEELKNKQVGILGLGTEGLSTAKYLLKKGIENITLLDQKEKELPEEIKTQTEQIFGPKYLESLENFDVLFRSPGVKLEQIADAKQKGVLVTSQTQVFLENHPLQTIGVTGTKGKGTTSSLIYEIFKKAGKKVFLGGNIGTAPFDFIDEVDEDSTVILELSSFQLVDASASPHTAVVLMVTSEHLDWHKDSEDYLNAKMNLTKFQNDDDLIVANTDFEGSRSIAENSSAQKYFFSTSITLENGVFVDGERIVVSNGDQELEFHTEKVKIPGFHNLQNICAAIYVTVLEGIDQKTIQDTLNEFKGLPHRLEFVEVIEGVKYFDDSASTTPETAIAAINSFSDPKIMVLGGSSKNSSFEELGRAVVINNVKAILLFGEEGPRIKESIQKAGNFAGEIVEEFSSMDAIVKKAKELSRAGDVVILSPGCASFGMFKNYVDRGKKFKEAVKDLLPPPNFKK